MSKVNKMKRFEIQPRDEAILRTLLDCRIMTIKQAASLHFGGSVEAAKKRLQKLHAAQFIAPRPRRVIDPALYSLTRKGHMNLKEEGMLDPLLELGWSKMQDRIQVSESLIKHELAVVDVKASLAPAIGKSESLALLEFTVNPERHAFQVTRAVLKSKKLAGFRSSAAKPDGFLHVKEERLAGLNFDHYFFLELDRGTETLRRLVQKAQSYSQYYRNGGFAHRRGFAREEFKRHPFRVLLIVQSDERRNNVAEKLLGLKTPIKNLIWLTSMKELLEDPLGQIWVRPSDYANAISGSSFDLATKLHSGIYRRHAEREEWIEKKVCKHPLFKGGALQAV